LTGTRATHTFGFNVCRLDEANGCNRLWKLQLVERVVVKVADQPAPPAYEVVVPTEVGIKPGAFAGWAERRDQTEVREHPQRPIDRIQRYRRHPLANTSQDGSRIRVLAALRDMTKDLQALMGDLDAGTSADLLEALHSTLHFLAVSRHRWGSSIRMYSDFGMIHHLSRLSTLVRTLIPYAEN
jgi:hypothetical protein